MIMKDFWRVTRIILKVLLTSELIVMLFARRLAAQIGAETVVAIWFWNSFFLLLAGMPLFFVTFVETFHRGLQDHPYARAFFYFVLFISFAMLGWLLVSEVASFFRDFIFRSNQ